MMQTDNHNFRKKVATDKKYVLKKMSLKFQNFKFDISCKIAFYIFFCVYILFGVMKSMMQKYKWLNKVECFDFLEN